MHLPTPPIYPSVKIIFKARGGRCKWDRAGGHFPYIGFNAKHAFREFFCQRKDFAKEKEQKLKVMTSLLQSRWTKINFNGTNSHTIVTEPSIIHRSAWGGELKLSNLFCPQAIEALISIWKSAALVGLDNLESTFH